MKFIAHRTLEEVLQDFMNCERPFNEDGSVTDEGSNAYAKLTNLLYDIGNMTGREMEDVVGALDFIMNEKFY